MAHHCVCTLGSKQSLVCLHALLPLSMQAVWLVLAIKIRTNWLYLKSDWASKLAFLHPNLLLNVQNVSGVRASESSASLLSFVAIRTMHLAIKSQCELTTLITFWYSGLEVIVQIMVHAEMVITVAEKTQTALCVCVQSYVACFISHLYVYHPEKHDTLS